MPYVVESLALSREKEIAEVMLIHILDNDSDRSQGQVSLVSKAMVSPIHF